MKTLQYFLSGQNLVHAETKQQYSLTNGEFAEVSLMISFYYLILSKMLVVDDWLFITRGFNRYLQTYTKP